MELLFTPLEETISFYTRNDFAVMNHLLTDNYDDLWHYAQIAYKDNRDILEEYAKGSRSVDSDYDIKWQNSLRKRLIGELDEAAKKTIIENAKSDIYNILHAMYPAQQEMLLYRTSWIDRKFEGKDVFPYSREYKTMSFETGSMIEIKIISSYSLTPYREDDDVGSNFFRYELHVPCGLPILELDPFITHNEDGEVLLPPMMCRVTDIRSCEHSNCKGIVSLEYIEPLRCNVEEM